MNRRSLIKLLSGLTVLPIVPSLSLANTSNKRVILLELSGANDGLNTVVPFKDDRYHELRPVIGLKPNNIITLDDTFGFNDALQDIMPVWEHGEMAVVHGLGYPNPNRSHFKSIELWETGSDGNKVQRNGWLTHDVEHAYAIANIDAHGISLGGSMGVFDSQGGNWLTMTTASQFSDRTLAPPSDQPANNNSMMQLLLDRAKTLNTSLDKIARKVENNQNRVKVKGSDKFNHQITHAINLINSGVDAPVLKLSLGGFDTHENQLGRHKNLLGKLAGGVSRLREELKKTDQWDNTVVLTYSEFGRRIEQNRSNGTDHGTASSHFVFGGNLAGGFHGKHPDLGNLKNGDLQHTMDYRALYSSILSDWLELPSNKFSVYENSDLGSIFS